MTNEDIKKDACERQRVIRGADGAIIGYWFPEDFWIYEEYLMKEHHPLLQRVHDIPSGTNIPRELWLEMKATFERFADLLGRKYTSYDTTSSTAHVQQIARGGMEDDKTSH